MQDISRAYIMVGLVWLIAGMVFGAWLGASGNLNYGNSHAHANLLGFVTSVLFGMLYWAWPQLARSKLAFAQFIIYELGALTLVIGKVLVDQGIETPMLQVGAIGAIIGAALMLFVFVKGSGESKA
jgi:peptidoglycan/LPS O-acetylase OafA/YrhL